MKAVVRLHLYALQSRRMQRCPAFFVFTVYVDIGMGDQRCHNPLKTMLTANVKRCILHIVLGIDTYCLLSNKFSTISKKLFAGNMQNGPCIVIVRLFTSTG